MQMAENMDLAEILAPQLVVPVAAVVLCAFVVFVFGFKRVAEPNFDFDSVDEKKKKHNKARKVKSAPSNGHVAAYETPKPAPQVVSTSVTVAGVPKDVQIKTKDQKVKKPVNAAVSKATAKPTDAPTSTAVQEETEGWTTCKSKKGKKKKGDSVRLEDALPVTVAEVTEVPVTTEIATPTDSPPQQQREAKAKRSRGAKSEPVAHEKTQPEEKQVKPEEISPKPVPPPEEKKAEESSAGVKPELKIPGLEFKPEETTPSKKKKKKKNSNKDGSPAPSGDVIPAPRDQTPASSSDLAPSRSDVTPALADVSPTSSDVTEASAKQAEAEDRLKNIAEQQSAQAKAKSAPPADISIEGQIADAMRESPQPSPTDTKPAKSPRKNSKKKNKSSGNKETGSHGKSSHTKSESPPSVQEAPGASTHMSSPPDAVSVGKVNDTNNASGDAALTPAPKSDSQPVEEADWQEAKPVKKRKKARREN